MIAPFADMYRDPLPSGHGRNAPADELGAAADEESDIIELPATEEAADIGIDEPGSEEPCSAEDGAIMLDAMSLEAIMLDAPMLDAGILDAPMLDIAILDIAMLDIGILDCAMLEAAMPEEDNAPEMMRALLTLPFGVPVAMFDFR